MALLQRQPVLSEPDPPTKVDEPSWLGIGTVSRWTIVALSLAAVVVLTSLLTLRSPSPPPSPSPPAYASASDCIEMILAQERAGQWQVAAANARTCLTRPNLSPESIIALVQKAIADGLQAINDSRINPDDYVAQQQAVDQYDDLKLFAAEKQTPLPKTFYEIAQGAASTGRFLLARAAFQDAFERGDVSSANFPHVRFIHDVNYNLGWWLSRNRANPKYDEGLRLLVAADRLDHQYHLGIGLAWAQLKLLEPNEASWPSPARTSLLGNDSSEKEK